MTHCQGTNVVVMVNVDVSLLLLSCFVATAG